MLALSIRRVRFSRDEADGAACRDAGGQGTASGHNRLIGRKEVSDLVISWCRFSHHSHPGSHDRRKRLRVHRNVSTIVETTIISYRRLGVLPCSRIAMTLRLVRV